MVATTVTVEGQEFDIYVKEAPSIYTAAGYATDCQGVIVATAVSFSVPAVHKILRRKLRKRVRA